MTTPNVQNTTPSNNGAPRPHRNQPIALVRLFSSVWFGIILMTLILVYSSLASAVPRIRGTLELSEMAIFRHWLFVTLVVLFVITMTVTTFRRVRFNATNLGVWTVHAGLILLAGGAAWYFGTKIEGDTQLFSPKIEILRFTAQQPERLGHMLAEDGNTWEGTSADGRQRLAIKVLQTKGDGVNPVSEISLQATVGQRTKSLALSTDQPALQISPGTLVRFQPATRVTKFYDKEVAALYVREKKNEPAREFAVLPELPEFMERFLPGGTPLEDANGNVVKSKRTRPTLANTGIPTGWFEQWRMPINVSDDALPFDISITGYLPYVGTRTSPSLVGQEPPRDLNPAIRFEIRDGDRTLLNQTLFANNPQQSLSGTQLPLEYVWVESPAEAERLLAPPIGIHELTVQIKDPPLEKKFAIRPGQEIPLEGTPYQLKVKALQPEWTMTTPGFEGAPTPIAMVDVISEKQSFMRTVVQRFPQLTQDIDSTGERHRTPLDDNIRLTYRSIERGWGYFLEGPDYPLTLAMIRPDGNVSTSQLTVDKPERRELMGGAAVNVIVQDHEKYAQLVNQPVVIPVTHRRPGVGRQASAIRVELTAKDAQSAWQQTHWLAYSQYPEIAPNPLIVRWPGEDVDDATDDRELELIYSREEHDLGLVLANEKLTARFQPGGFNADFWRSDFLAKHPDGAITAQHVETNVTATVGRWTYFQSGAPQDEQWEYTVLGVGNRRGIWPMVLGCILVPLGSFYAFYIKPWLISSRKRKALATAQARGVGKRDASTADREESESLVKV